MKTILSLMVSDQNNKFYFLLEAIKNNAITVIRC